MSKNPFIFSDNYRDLDIQDYDAEEAYEMGVSAGMDTNKQLLDRIDGNLPEPENFGNGFDDLVHLDDVKAIINQERGKL